MNKIKELPIKIILGTILIICVISIFGCGSSGGGDDDWNTGSNVIRISNLKGRVIAPIMQNTSTREAYFSLVTTANTKVFLEDDSSKYAITNAYGDFIIPNVPEGRHRIIANVVSGTTAYRQRSDVIVVTGQYETQIIDQAIELQPALYNLTLHVADLKTGSPISAKANIWGFTFDIINGVANVGPFPGGSLSKEVTINCIGYRESKCLVTFGEENKSEIYVYLTPNSSTDSNQAPVVEIQQSSLTARTNEEIGVTGIGLDPEGDILSWKWSAESGEFYNQNAQQTIYRAPDTPGKVRISLTGTDSKGASGKAILDIQVEQGSSPGVDPQNKPPVAPHSPFPANKAENMDGSIVLTWECSDPNKDEITYTVNFGEQGQILSTIATDLKEKSFVVNNLKANTKYFWQVTAYDEHYASTNSELWQFSTGNLNNLPPNIPTYPNPAHLAKDIIDNVSFSWSGGDPDGDPVTYKIKLATISTWLESKPTELTEIKETNLLKYDYKGLARGATYQWQVIAQDSHGAQAIGPVWEFSTLEPENHAPSKPEAIEPLDKATAINVATLLRWKSEDEDGDTVYYDVYFGKNSDDMALVVSSQTSQIYKPESLEYETKYYWKVIAYDGKGANTTSELWSFTTQELAAVDPEIISIESPTSISGYLTVNFNKYIDDSKMSGAVSFVPSVEGTWTWQNDNTVAKFKPTSGSWLPGSYNKITVAANVLADSDGKLIKSSRTERFTIPSSVPVPAGYRSYGFPMQVPSNTTVTIPVPELSYGRNSYVLAIADADNTTATVSSMRASVDNTNNAINSSDPTFALRLREAEMMSNPIVIPSASMANKSVNASALGDSKSFYLDSVATTTSYPRNVITTTLLAQSGNSMVYVDDSITDSNKANVAQKVLNTFDGRILQKVRNSFGNEPELGVDGEGRVSIVLINLPAENGLAGYFTSADLYARESSSAYRISNQGKIIYIKYGMRDSTTFGTLAHEFQHMVNYYQKNKTLRYTADKVFEEVWLNEALAKYSEEVCGYSLLDGDENTTLLVASSMRNNNDLSLTYWGDNTTNCYGQVYLFMHFLAQPGRYNSDSTVITRALVSGNEGKSIGTENIENVTGEPFKETMAKWALSCFINNHSSQSPSAYGIYNINLNGRYNDVSLPGYQIENIRSTISLTRMKMNAMRCFRKSSTGNSDTTITVTTGSRPITLWLFDERE